MAVDSYAFEMIDTEMRPEFNDIARFINIAFVNNDATVNKEELVGKACGGNNKIDVSIKTHVEGTTKTGFYSSIQNIEYIENSIEFSWFY